MLRHMGMLLHIWRVLDCAAQLAHDCIAGEAQLPQNLADRLHHLGQSIRRNHDQRYDQKQEYLKDTQATSST